MSGEAHPVSASGFEDDQDSLGFGLDGEQVLLEVS
jgi:hypothetical protein